MRRAIVVAGCSALLFVVLVHPNGSAGEHPTTTPPANSPTGLIVRGSVHSIRLPEDEAVLPEGAGRETTQLFCGMCHTTQYIMIQPRLLRETWLAEVAKMRGAFSGPIPEEKVGEIVEYLSAVRGVTTK